jgi:hypothetical protein
MEQLFQQIIDAKIYRNGTLHKGYRKSSNIKKHFPEIYTQIIDKTNFLAENVSFGERLYCVEHNIRQKPVCKECGGEVKYKDRKYHTYCSLKCSNNAKDVKRKKEQTNINKFGVPYASMSEKIKTKQRCTFNNNYGVDYPFQSHIIQQKLKDNWVKKYGVDNPRKSFEIQEKIKTTKNEKYGKESWAQLHIPNNTLEKLKNKEWMYENHVILKKPLTELANELKVSDVTIGNYLSSHNIDTHHFQMSVAEKEITAFLNDVGITTINNTRDIIHPKEIDIFLPDYNLAIEYCGLYWHSENMKNDKLYHKLKMEECVKLDIQLLTIFEDEWTFKKDIVKNTLLHLTNKSSNSIYARKCNIKVINSKDKDTFFNNYHIQGTSRGTINLGLFHHNDLVACMSFLKNKNEYILNRYATSGYVVGGFSKLLKFFQSNYEWTQLVSFADLRWSNGKVYELNGWTLDTILPPDYSYIEYNKRVHKFNYRHKHLPKKLKNYDSQLSEWENCKNNNIYRIWNCGLKRYIITKP